MPHVVVKALSGRTDEQKARLAEAIARTVVNILECDDSAVSVACEDVTSERWKEEVYLPDIQGRWDILYKKPGYQM